MKPPRETPDTDLASYLARRFGRGEAASSTAASPSGTRSDSAASDGIDENDLAAFALGELPRGRRAVLSARLARDPAARDAVAFERALRPTPFLLRHRVAVAAAAVLLVAFALPLLLRRSDPLDTARLRLADGATGEAVAVLEAALADDEGPTRSLLALARVANGDVDPARGLALSGDDLDILPLSAVELAARDPGPRRQDPTTADLVVTPRGLLLAERPTLRLLAADEELSVRILELESGTELARLPVARRDAKLGARLSWPSTAPLPKSDIRYALEVRNPDGEVRGFSEFTLADSALRTRVASRLAAVEPLVARTPRHAAFRGWLCFRLFLYEDAIDAFESIPAALLTPAESRALGLARAHLVR